MKDKKGAGYNNWVISGCKVPEADLKNNLKLLKQLLLWLKIWLV